MNHSIYKAPRRRLHPVRASFVALAAALVLATGATAATALAPSEDASKYTVETVSPSGTTINLFDYWVHGDRDTNDYWNVEKKAYWGDSDLATFLNEGINKGHQLAFSRTSGGIKDKVQGATLYANNDSLRDNFYANNSYHLLSSTLQDGYPALSADATFKNDSRPAVDPSHSLDLSYLFDASQQEGKQRFANVKGLLQLQDGYYVYNSQDNFAEFDEDSNSFNVYNNWAVKTTNATKEGQFFPFDKATEVFDKKPDGSLKADASGKLVPRNLASNGTDKAQAAFNFSSKIADINHFFGMSMTTRFMQPKDGIADNGKAMTYYFSGDDDAMVYIDGVLVGDLAGIHDALTLDIDFKTGEVKVSSAQDPKKVFVNTDLRTLFEKAGASTAAFEDGQNHFRDNTIHTLKFFYLERGNLDSNLSLKYNLVDVPASGLIKIDQTGQTLAGAQFALYAVDDDYSWSSAELISSGETQSDGSLIFMDENSNIITFDELAKEEKKHFLLRETKAPDGYRKIGDLKLKYVEGSGNLQSGEEPEFSGHLLADDDTNWQTGTWAGVGLQVKAPTTIYKDNNGQKGDELGSSTEQDKPYNDGTIFAVILYYEGEGQAQLTDQSKWRTVTGNSLDGWDIDEDAVSIGQAIESARRSPHIFKLTENSGGAYMTDFDELPGYIETYYNYIDRLGTGDNKFDKTKFTVAYYYTEASDLQNATESNTSRIWMGDANEITSTFRRQFSIQLYVPNMQNYLIVQKTDEEFNPLMNQGKYKDLTATFSLYSAASLDETHPVNDDGTIKLKDGAVPVDTTTARRRGEDEDGQRQFYLQSGAAFPSSENAILENGNYYLVEDDAPLGFARSVQATHIVVSDEGVFADAGKKDDDVRVLNGVGTLVHNMAQFASGSERDVNLTLRDITATQEVNADGTSEAWKATGKQLQLTYAGEGATMEYYPTSWKREDDFPDLSQITVMNDEGWSRLQVRQNLEDGVQSNRKTDLGDTSLNSLFSGVTIVQVRNELQGSLSIQKKLQAGDSTVEPGQAFTMQVTLTDADGKPLTGTYGVRYVDASGNQIEGTPTRLTFDGQGQAMVSLGVNQKIVIGTAIDRDEGGAAGTRLVPGTKWCVTEVDLPEHYQQPALEVNGEKVEGDAASGTIGKSDDPWLSGALDDPGISLVTVTNRTNVIGLTVKKVDATTGKPLKGAKFAIRLDDGTPTEGFVPTYDENADTLATLYPTAESTTPVAWPQETGDNGTFTVYGLQRGRIYWLVETATPAGGYQLLAPVAFKVEKDGSLSFFDSREPATAKKDQVTLTIANRGVPSLPKTGGMGIYPLLVGGMALMGGAAYMVSRAVAKRRGSEK